MDDFFGCVHEALSSRPEEEKQPFKDCFFGIRVND